MAELRFAHKWVLKCGLQYPEALEAYLRQLEDDIKADKELHDVVTETLDEATIMQVLYQ